MSKRRAALLQRHGIDKLDFTHPERFPPDRYKIVLMDPHQSEDFDADSATRKWLWPHLGRDYHLIEFIDVVDQ